MSQNSLSPVGVFFNSSDQSVNSGGLLLKVLIPRRGGKDRERSSEICSPSKLGL